MDKLVVPSGFKTDLVATWGDSLETSGPFGKEYFGYDNDFLAFFPLDALTTNRNQKEGLLWVNHEAVNPLFVSHFTGEGAKSKEQILAEKLAIGGSVLHVKREKGKWLHVPGGKYTRRVTTLYPEMEVTGPAGEVLRTATGTMGNCSGGKTLWQTVLSCEENYTNGNGPYGWDAYPETKLDEARYGWVVEIDPFGELPPQKHSALGRFAHENTAMGLGKSGRLVVYMGDDDQDQYFYKFVSEGKYVASASRAEKRKLLTSGTLYAADFAKGRWIPLDIEQNKALKESGFKSQAEVLQDTRRAAGAVKATPVDRPEDCEIHPRDGSIYVAFTNNVKHGNLYGQIARMVEDGDDHEAEKFRYELFLAGGPQSGLSAPDNLAFDKHANLWVACDISSSQLNRNAQEPFMNNGLYMIPTSGGSLGEAFQFASGPNDSELTGPWFTDNGDTLFLAVQHPGETSINPKSPTSRWPKGGSEIPRPAVVAITGF